MWAAAERRSAESEKLTGDVGVVVEDAALGVDDEPLLLLLGLVPVHLEVLGEQPDLLAVEGAIVALRRARIRAELGKPGAEWGG